MSLAEQVTPIIDLMAISNAHFAKLRDFITLRLPPGFPVKIGGCGSILLEILPSCMHADDMVFKQPISNLFRDSIVSRTECQSDLQ